MWIRNSHGLASQAVSRESDSDSQAFLIFCESPYHRRFLQGVGTVHLSCGFAVRMDSQAKRIRASPTPIHLHMPISEYINTVKHYLKGGRVMSRYLPSKHSLGPEHLRVWCVCVLHLPANVSGLVGPCGATTHAKG